MVILRLQYSSMKCSFITLFLIVAYCDTEIHFSGKNINLDDPQFKIFEQLNISLGSSQVPFKLLDICIGETTSYFLTGKLLTLPPLPSSSLA